MRRGVDAIAIEKGVYGREAASALNAGQFLVGLLAGDLAANAALGVRTEQDKLRHGRTMRPLQLFEEIPKGQRLRPRRRYQHAASP